MSATTFIGTAGWSVAKRYDADYPGPGTHLARYAARMNAVEIDTSFYRPHRVETYARWAASVPKDFRFAVKLPKAITHDRRLTDVEALLDRFAAEVGGLGVKLGVLLVQLPPNLPFVPATASAFFGLVRDRFAVPIACEPRHPSWFTGKADRSLIEVGVARVAADPPPAPGADAPGGCRDFAYQRLHGAPRLYYSDYGAEALTGVEARLRRLRDGGIPAWCIFDNTAAFHALGNAMTVQAAMAAGRR